MIRGMLPAQSVVACLKFDAFCKMHRRRVCSLLRAKREPERTAVPAGHESPSGAFKPQTGLRSKCRVFSAARSPLLSRRGRRRVAAPCVCFVPWAALASCRPLPQQLLPVSAAGRGRRRCKAVGLHTKNPSRSARGFFVLRRFQGPSAAAAAAPRRGAGALVSFVLKSATLPHGQSLPP